MLKNKNRGTLQCYSNVTLKVFKNNIHLKTFKYHNTVTMNLFIGINSFLRGEVKAPDFLSNYIPQYLGISSTAPVNGYDVNSNDLPGESQIPRIPLTNNPSIITNNILSIPFTAIIPYKSIGSTPLKSLGLFGIEQFRGDPGNTDQLLLAGVVLEEPITINPGSSVLVEWDINLQTPTTIEVGNN